MLIVAYLAREQLSDGPWLYWGKKNQAASTQMPVYLVETMLYSFLNLKKTTLELRNVISNSTLTWLIFNNCRKRGWDNKTN